MNRLERKALNMLYDSVASDLTSLFAMNFTGFVLSHLII